VQIVSCLQTTSGSFMQLWIFCTSSEFLHIQQRPSALSHSYYPHPAVQFQPLFCNLYRICLHLHLFSKHPFCAICTPLLCSLRPWADVVTLSRKEAGCMCVCVWDRGKEREMSGEPVWPASVQVAAGEVKPLPPSLLLPSGPECFLIYTRGDFQS
jgi:hypothetical protein